MGYKIDFKTYEELTTFIDFASDLLLWGTKKFELISSTGAVMNIDTNNYMMGSSGKCVPFSTLRPYIKQYYTNNGSLPIILDIKLICPDSFRASADPNNYYQAFYINFYSNKTINYINLSYDENGENLVTEPYTVFVSYIKDMYNNWKVYYASEYQS